MHVEVMELGELGSPCGDRSTWCPAKTSRLQVLTRAEPESVQIATNPQREEVIRWTRFEDACGSPA